MIIIQLHLRLSGCGLVDCIGKGTKRKCEPAFTHSICRLSTAWINEQEKSLTPQAVYVWNIYTHLRLRTLLFRLIQ